jgi:hypothetical protein
MMMKRRRRRITTNIDHRQVVDWGQLGARGRPVTTYGYFCNYYYYTLLLLQVVDRRQLGARGRPVGRAVRAGCRLCGGGELQDRLHIQGGYPGVIIMIIMIIIITITVAIIIIS